MKKYFKKVLLGFGVFAAMVFIFLLSPLWLMDEDRIYVEVADVPARDVAIVFGAGLNADGRPSDALSDRLISAAELYFSGKVNHILVSGDNSVENYNEPEAMAAFLVEWGVPEGAISLDFAGRRTYDTCARAKTVWGIDSAILVTQDFHLPRALFTCNALGVDSYGYSASLQPYVDEDYWGIREFFAVYKAILDVYVLKPDYVGGEPETL